MASGVILPVANAMSMSDAQQNIETAILCLKAKVLVATPRGLLHSLRSNIAAPHSMLSAGNGAIQTRHCMIEALACGA